jgi:hypothetical protein
MEVLGGVVDFVRAPSQSVPLEVAGNTVPFFRTHFLMIFIFELVRSLTQNSFFAEKRGFIFVLISERWSVFYDLLYI